MTRSMGGHAAEVGRVERPGWQSSRRRRLSGGLRDGRRAGFALHFADFQPSVHLAADVKAFPDELAVLLVPPDTDFAAGVGLAVGDDFVCAIGTVVGHVELEGFLRAGDTRQPVAGEQQGETDGCDQC